MKNENNLKTFGAGHTIIKQGDEGHSAYIIEEGSVDILVEKDNGLVQLIGTRGPGSLIGEMALVDNKPRTATIKAIEDCTLLEITKNDFESRLSSTDPVVHMVMNVILTRYRDMITRSHILRAPQNNTPSEDLERNFLNDTNAVDEIKLTNDLKKSVQNQDFILHYQPIINTQNNAIAGFEALIRWNHPTKGLIYPDAFIDTAEASDLITEISRWVVKESCEFLSRMQKQFPAFNKLFMSVNFTAKDFDVPDFKDFILKSLKHNNLTADQFHIEITERLLMDDPTNAQNALQSCRESGLLISIDDFGTGYSSLSYLHAFPIDILKIDRSFITHMEHDKSSQGLVSSIISLGHNMGMSIIAEGIEEEAQHEALKKLGCDKIQGYLYSRPIPENEMIKFLQAAS